MARYDLSRWPAGILGKINPNLRNWTWQALYGWRAVQLIRQSGLFDETFYSSQFSSNSSGNGDLIRHYVTEGARQGLDPCPLFSTTYYLETYPDVATSGINPLAHYLIYGAAEGRNASADFQTAYYLDLNPDIRQTRQNPLAHYVTTGQRLQQKTKAFDIGLSSIALAYPRCTSLENFRVVFISGLPSTPSHRYRVDHQVEALGKSGIEAESYRLDEAHRHEEAIYASDILVLFRVAWDENVARIVGACRSLGAAVVYDVDDYVFEPKIATPELVDGIRFLNENDLPRYQDGVKRYRQTLMECDFGIFTTSYLAARAAELGKTAYVLNNGFDETTKEASTRILGDSRTRARERDGRKVRIGYLSGTLTHQRDFREAAPALLRVLEERPEVVLRVVGSLDLGEFPEFDRFGERVERRALVDYYELPLEFSQLDIHIAPLEIGNPFCESKSELKFYEGALLEVPLVASSTSVFEQAVEHGRTGFLARTPEDWYEALSHLACDRELRRRVGRAARAAALERYGPRRKQEVAARIFREIAGEARSLRGWRRQARVVTIILPPMLKGGGGHHKLIQFAKLVSSRGYEVLLQFTGPTNDYPAPHDVIQEFRLDEERVNVLYAPVMKFNSDITFCSFWKTVAAVKESACSPGEVFYFLQDYEPYFYPMGSEYLEAVSTFHEPFHLISSGSWIKSLLAKRHGLDADSVSFCFDKSIYRKLPDVRRHDKTILFVAQPAKPRRCFDLGIRALRRFVEKYKVDANVVFFGSSDVRGMNFGFPHVDMGILNPEELCRLYNEATLAVVLSATNLSYLPYEMMACGLPVLDLDLEDSVLNYGSRDNVFLAPVDVELFADTIHRALTDREGWHRVSRNGYEFAMQIPQADETVRELLDIVEARIARRHEGVRVANEAS